MKISIGVRISLILLIVLAVSQIVSAESVGLDSGHSYYVELETSMGTLNWAGAEISLSSAPLEESRFPITVPMTLATPTIWKPYFPGSNFVDDHHYFAAMFPEEFDLNNVRDMTAADVGMGGVFSSSNYPQFYPDYLGKHD